jgi:hypothetical protein
MGTKTIAIMTIAGRQVKSEVDLEDIASEMNTGSLIAKGLDKRAGEKMPDLNAKGERIGAFGFSFDQMAVALAIMKEKTRKNRESE